MTTYYQSFGIKYMIRYHAEIAINDLPYTLWYQWENSWRYCGDYESVNDALKYADKRGEMLSNGESVML